MGEKNGSQTEMQSLTRQCPKDSESVSKSSPAKSKVLCPKRSKASCPDSILNIYATSEPGLGQPVYLWGKHACHVPLPAAKVRRRGARRGRGGGGLRRTPPHILGPAGVGCRQPTSKPTLHTSPDVDCIYVPPPRTG